MTSIPQKPKIVIIVGPTCSGKTDLALGLAERFCGEIVNADSMQVYRGMDIGTAKPTPEQRERVPHHLIDIVEPDVNFSASDFRNVAVAAISDILSRDKKVFVVGGTGLYIKALLKGLVDSPSGDESIRRELHEKARIEGGETLLSQLGEVDPETAARLHPNDVVRIVRALEVFLQTGTPISRFRDEHDFSLDLYDYLKIGLMPDRDMLYRRIEERVDAMLAEGFMEEVRGLLSRGYHAGLKSMRSIGYKEMAAYLEGKSDFEETVSLMKRDTRRYAKRQFTWFRSDKEINWVEFPYNFVTISNRVIQFFC